MPKIINIGLVLLELFKHIIGVRFFFDTVYTVVQKTSPNFCPYLRQMLTDFQNSFTDTLRRNIAITWLLNILPHLNSVATLVPRVKYKFSKITIGLIWINTCAKAYLLKQFSTNLLIHPDGRTDRQIAYSALSIKLSRAIKTVRPRQIFTKLKSLMHGQSRTLKSSYFGVKRSRWN